MSATKDNNGMNDAAIGFDQAHDDILAFDLSDEVLEAAAGVDKEKTASQTVAYCSGFVACPS